MEENSIRIVITGGTFDKYYNELKGELTFKETNIYDVLKRARLSVKVLTEVLPLMDSLDMTEADRLRILDSCVKSSEKQILITHGTDTMAVTAKLLGERKLNKTIVLTGAMIPYLIKNSDAFFNFGFAMASVQTLPVGVYIAMNGKIFSWNRVAKDRSLGVFVEEL